MTQRGTHKGHISGTSVPCCGFNEGQGTGPLRGYGFVPYQKANKGNTGDKTRDISDATPEALEMTRLAWRCYANVVPGTRVMP